MTDAQPDLTISLFGADSLFSQVGALVREIAGVKQGEDIEYVHRMRVASRRLRTRLQIFAPWLPAKKVESWQKQIRRITTALGKARDTDVQLDFVRQFREQLTDPRQRPGIDRLILRLAQRRTRAQTRVIKALEKVEGNHALEELAQTLRQLRVLRHLQHVEPRSAELYRLACQSISAQLANMLSYEPYIHHPESATELHAMRIATKHLRYVMELFTALYPGALKPYLQAARAMQDLLGDIHDSDVWQMELAQFHQQELVRAQHYLGHSRGVHRLRAGIEALLDDRRAFREKRYQAFVSLWERHEHELLWQELQKTIQPPVAESEE